MIWLRSTLRSACLVFVASATALAMGQISGVPAAGAASGAAGPPSTITPNLLYNGDPVITGVLSIDPASKLATAALKLAPAPREAAAFPIRIEATGIEAGDKITLTLSKFPADSNVPLHVAADLKTGATGSAAKKVPDSIFVLATTPWTSTLIAQRYRGFFSVGGQKYVAELMVGPLQPLVAPKITPSPIRIGFLQDFLVGDSSHSIELRLWNPNQIAVSVMSTDAWLQLYDANGNPKAPMCPDSSVFLGPRSYGALKFRVPSGWDAGIYSGSIRLFPQAGTSTGAASLEADVKLDLRDSPVGVFGVLAFGFAIGFYAWFLGTGRQTNLFQIASLELPSNLKGLDKGPANGFLVRLEELRSRVEKSDLGSQANLTTEIANIGEAIKIAQDATFYRSQTSDNSLKGEFDAVVAQALAGDNDVAKTSLKSALEQLLGPSPAPADNAAPTPAPATIAMAHLAVRVSRPADVRGQPWARDFVRGIQRARFALTVVGVAVVLMIGFQQLYINAPGFGHTAFDYVKTFTWGFLTGIAGRGLFSTLSSLQGMVGLLLPPT